MTAEQFLKSQKRTGLTCASLAHELGVSERTVYRYRRNGCREPVAKLMRGLEG